MRFLPGENLKRRLKPETFMHGEFVEEAKR